jgi:hypothetical protein
MSNEEELWLAARERMRPYVSAVFWQDFGIDGEEHDRAVNWMLDHIFRPEFIGATDRPVWSVMRQDDNGNHFTVAHGLSHAAAESMLKQFEESGHKQFYWILPKPNESNVA